MIYCDTCLSEMGGLEEDGLAYVSLNTEVFSLTLFYWKTGTVAPSARINIWTVAM